MTNPSMIVAAVVGIVAFGAFTWLDRSQWTLQDKQDQGMLAKPGPEHERLMKLAGTYTSKTKMQRGSQILQSGGDSTLKPGLGGRFLVQDEKNEIPGMTFEAMKVHGYNASAKRYESVWMYTNSTSMMTMNGTSDDGGKTVKYRATYMEGAEPTNLEVIFKEIDGDNFSLTIASANQDGAKGTTMETVYTRKK